MKMLTVKPLWAWLLFYSDCDVVNVTWWTRYRGPLAIRTAGHLDPAEWVETEAFCASIGRLAGLPSAIVLQQGRRMTFGATPDVIPCGAVLGVVDVVDCVWERRSRWFTGPYGLLVSDARPLAEPLPTEFGHMGLWDPPAAVVGALEGINGGA